MFSKLYLWEIKKMISTKGLIVLAIIAVLAILLINGMFNISTEVTLPAERPGDAPAGDESMPLPEEEEEAPFAEEEVIPGLSFDYEQGAYTVTEQAARMMLESARQYYEQVKAETVKDKYFYRGNDTLYTAKAELAMWQYVVDKKLYDTPFRPYSGMAALALNSLNQKTAQGFMSLYLSVMGSAIIIYGIVCGANAYGKEIKKGTLKMVMIRPLSRDKLTAAKLLAALSLATAFFITAIVIAYIFGIIAYKNVVFDKVIYVFNASRAFVASSNFILFLVIGSLLVQIWGYAVFAMSLSTITKSNVIGIIIPVLINMGITNLVLSFFGLSRFLFSYSIGMLAEYFTVSPMVFRFSAGSLTGGADFWLSLGILSAYLAVFVASTFFVFKKRDVA